MGLGCLRREAEKGRPQVLVQCLLEDGASKMNLHLYPSRKFYDIFVCV